MSERATGDKTKVVQVNMVVSQEMALPITAWKSYSFAPEWYEDALNEARRGKDHNSRRREIVFAVCCIESYLLEWVRDDVLNWNFSGLGHYFPGDDRRGIRERWKEIIKTLHSEGRIRAIPDFNEPYWEHFTTLIGFRDGLVHGRSSRPSSDSQDEDLEPRPSKHNLNKMEPGWATRTIARTIRKLHAATGTKPPGWLVDP